MEKVISRCVELIEASTESENERLIISDAIQKRLAKKTHISKLKEIAELVACQYLGLTWRSHTPHGADAVDQNNRKVELKTAIVENTPRNSISINYAVKGSRAKTLEHYSSEEFQGGHYWVGMNGDNTKVLWSVHVSRSRFLQILNEKKSLSKALNFGSTLCKKCKRCKRLDKLAGLAPCGH
jgi:hypothetical protein